MNGLADNHFLGEIQHSFKCPIASQVMPLCILVKDRVGDGVDELLQEVGLGLERLFRLHVMRDVPDHFDAGDDLPWESRNGEAVIST